MTARSPDCGSSDTDGEHAVDFGRLARPSVVVVVVPDRVVVVIVAAARGERDAPGR